MVFGSLLVYVCVWGIKLAVNKLAEKLRAKLFDLKLRGSPAASTRASEQQVHLQEQGILVRANGTTQAMRNYITGLSRSRGPNRTFMLSRDTTQEVSRQFVAATA